MADAESFVTLDGLVCELENLSCFLVLASVVLLDLLLLSAASIVSTPVDFEFEEEADAPRMKDVTSGIYCLRFFLEISLLLSSSFYLYSVFSILLVRQLTLTC